MFKQTKLKNGLTLITAPVAGTKTVTVLVMVGTGSKYEEKENNGISHFLEHMFFKGTEKRPNTLTISSELDAVGAEFNAFTSKEYTAYYVKVDSSKTDLALDVVSDILINSKFAAEEIERERGVIIEEINMKQDDPMGYVEDLYEELLYGDTPAGRDIIGTKESVGKISRRDFLKYFGAQYQPLNTAVCLAGNISAVERGKPDAAVKKIEKYFAAFAAKHQSASFKEKTKVKVRQAEPRIRLHFKETDQAHFCLGAHAFPYRHKKEIAARLLGVILGGSMSSRLFTEVRERRGLAYYVRAHHEPYTDSGYLAAQAGVSINKIEEAARVMLAEFKKLKEKLVSPEELRRNKDLIRGRVIIQLELSDDVAEWYSRQAVLLATQKRSGRIEDKIITPEEFFKKIERVTAEEIREVAREIFADSKLNLAIIGPFKDSKRLLDLLKIS